MAKFTVASVASRKARVRSPKDRGRRFLPEFSAAPGWWSGANFKTWCYGCASGRSKKVTKQGGKRRKRLRRGEGPGYFDKPMVVGSIPTGGASSVVSHGKKPAVPWIPAARRCRDGAEESYIVCKRCGAAAPQLCSIIPPGSNLPARIADRWAIRAAARERDAERGELRARLVSLLAPEIVARDDEVGRGAGQGYFA